MRKNDTPFNILYSFAYYSKTFAAKLFNAAEQGLINVMIDSGAFSDFNSKSNKINIDNYCDFLKEAEPYIEKAVMLDVIGNAEASRRNYEAMVARGTKPMFTVTAFDKNWDYIKQTLDICENICVAGGATTKGPWMTKRFQDVYYNTGERARIHGLAYVVDTMFTLPIVSVDSSSQNSALRYGNFIIWDDNTHHKRGLPYIDYARGKRRLNEEEIAFLERIRVTPEEFFGDTARTGGRSVIAYCSFMASIFYQIFCKAQGLDYFFAIASEQELDSFLFLYRNFSYVTYKDFANLK